MSAVIRNQSTGLVLDVNPYGQITLQYYTGAPNQLWRLEPTFDGKCLIISMVDGRALDIEGGPAEGANLITYDKHGGDNQQWMINAFDNTIVSGYYDLAMDVCGGCCAPGASIIVWPRHGGPNQRFSFEYQ